MNRNRAPLMALFAAIGVAVISVVALCILVLAVIMPRIAHRFSSLDTPSNPNMSVAEHNTRGNEYYRQRLFKRAAAEYGHMIEKAPDQPDGYLLRAMAESEQGDHKAAVRDNTEALKYARNTGTRDALFFNRGLAYRNLGDYKAAIPDLTQAIALDRNNTEAFEVRAFCYTALGQNDNAIADYTVALGRNPHPGTIFERGQAYLNKKDYENALADLDHSLQLRPNFPAGYRLRANVYVAQKEYDKAVADAEKTLQLENTPANRGNLGWMQYLAGKLPEAIASSQAAIQADPKLVFAQFNLGLCYAVQGDTASATTAYEAALRNAKSTDIQAGLQDIKDALKKSPNSSALKQEETQLQSALAHAHRS